jgi:hypothetical protein
VHQGDDVPYVIGVGPGRTVAARLDPRDGRLAAAIAAGQVVLDDGVAEGRADGDQQPDLSLPVLALEEVGGDEATEAVTNHDNVVVLGLGALGLLTDNLEDGVAHPLVLQAVHA